ncbi:hypothetical protein HC231_06135 [Brenneria izadpanahii]|uniref:DUF3828 domain-containing protein n=1 Tax=Brenneria izadpanahii TaxID=2722756 RepID=A0ABX7UV25_9GAMM|nr:hypothetical protein [Brenneria izadpanahii]QTF07548.1 hypothetical protein HC231_06135 [Brenneria izadpanahii]
MDTPLACIKNYFAEMKALDDLYLPLPADDNEINARLEKMTPRRAEIYQKYWCRNDDYWLDNSYGDTSRYTFDDSMLIESGENFNDAVFIVIQRRELNRECRELWLFKLTNDGWKIADLLIFDE